MEYSNLINSGQDNDVGSAIQELIKDNLRALNTAFIAEIVAVNSNRVNVKPFVKSKQSEQTVIINNCLVCFTHSHLWDFQHKLAVGDIGLGVVIQNDISNYKNTGQESVAATRRFKDITDTVFIPLSLYESLINENINFLIESNTKKCKLEFDNSEMGIFKAKLLTLESENTTLKKALKELVDLLESMAGGQTSADGHGHTTTTAPSSIGVFSSWYNTTINSLFKD